MGKFDWAKLNKSGGEGAGGAAKVATTSRRGRATPPPLPRRNPLRALLGGRAGCRRDLRRILLVRPPRRRRPGKVLVLLKKDGIARRCPAIRSSSRVRPIRKPTPPATTQWEKRIRRLQRHPRAGLSRRHVLRLQPVRLRALTSSMPSIVPNDKVGIVIKKFGEKLDDGQVLADPRAISAGRCRACFSRRVQRVLQPVRVRGEAGRPGAGRSRPSRRRHRDGRQRPPKNPNRVPRRRRRAGRAAAHRAGRLPLHQPLRQAHHADQHHSRSDSR